MALSGNPVTFTAGPGAVCTSGGTNGSTITIQGAGTCSVNADQAGNASYAAASTVTRTFNVTKAPLTVTADPQTKVQGSPNPTLTSTISGYVLGQNVGTSGVTGAPSCTTTATNASVPGGYPITCALGTLAAANYSFSYAAGTLTVTAPGTRRRRSRTSSTRRSTRTRHERDRRSRSVTARRRWRA